jgi:phage FluMu protein Com
MSRDLAITRAKAWATRRARYGASGHAGAYARSSVRCPHCKALADFIIRLHSEGTLSEGQAARVTRFDRVTVRKMTDAYETGAPA